MVPFGFILIITSLIVWLSLTIPDQCISKSYEEEASKMSQPNDPGNNSLCNLKRWSWYTYVVQYKFSGLILLLLVGKSTYLFSCF